MRCTCCNRLLNDFESVRKSKTTGEFLDVCNKCYTTIASDVPSSSSNTYEPNDIPDDEVEFESNYDEDEYDDR